MSLQQKLRTISFSSRPVVCSFMLMAASALPNISSATTTKDHPVSQTISAPTEVCSIIHSDWKQRPQHNKSNGQANLPETYSGELQNAAMTTITKIRLVLASSTEYVDLVSVTENIDLTRDGFVGVYIKLGRQLGCTPISLPGALY